MKRSGDHIGEGVSREAIDEVQETRESRRTSEVATLNDMKDRQEKLRISLSEVRSERQDLEDRRGEVPLSYESEIAERLEELEAIEDSLRHDLAVLHSRMARIEETTKDSS